MYNIVTQDVPILSEHIVSLDVVYWKITESWK